LVVCLQLIEKLQKTVFLDKISESVPFTKFGKEESLYGQLLTLRIMYFMPSFTEKLALAMPQRWHSTFLHL
jgi:hypothetical protein